MTDKELKERLDVATEKMNPLVIALVASKAMNDLAVTANNQSVMIHRTLQYIMEKVKERRKSEQKES